MKKETVTGTTDEADRQPPIDLRLIEKRAWLLVLILTVASLAFRSFRITGGVALGGLLAMLNYLWLKKFVLDVFERKKGKKVSKLNAILYISKYVLTGAVIFAVVKYNVINIFGLLAGLTVVIIAITIEGTIKTAKLTREDNGAP